LGFFVAELVGHFKTTELAYIKLNKDYVMDNGSHIAKGTMLQIDKGFSEGFTRYLLYVNISDADIPDSSFVIKRNVKNVHWLRD
jgi:hypothetical protein